MLEYFKQRFLLDWNFVKDFWWAYIIGGLLVFITLIIIRINERKGIKYETPNRRKRQ